MTTTPPRPMCIGCSRYANQITELVQEAEWEDMTPDEYAEHDGTYNRLNGHFLCDECYIEAGSPSTPRGWIAP